MYMDSNLFYRNDFSIVTSAPDPFILYDDGWFYLYFTEIKSGVLAAYKSRDMATWEKVWIIYERDESYWAHGRYWAPKVFKYPKDGKYYLYCACSGNGEIGLPEGTSLDRESSVYASEIMDRLHLTVLVADSPEGPFKEWTGSRYIEKFYHGESLGMVQDEVTLTSGPIFDFANAPAGWETNKAHYERNGTNIFAQLDPMPFLDDDGQLYLYFTRSRDINDQKHKQGGWGVKMIDPVTPDYNTLTCLNIPGYYTVGGERSTPDIDDDVVNEGVGMIKHKTVRPDGSETIKYYLTYSRSGMGCPYYSACLAVADSPLGYAKGSKEAPNGGFVKVPSQYGNPMHCIAAWRDEEGHWHNEPSYDMYQATGNGMFFRVGEEDFLVSLCTVLIPEKKSRNFIIDRIVWQYIEELGYDVPHSNGPTQASLQPLPAQITGYENVAKQAGLSVNAGGDAELLTDGYVAIHARDDDMVYYADKDNLCITLTLDKPRTLRSIMVYNTWDKSRAFAALDKVELINGETGSMFEDIPFSEEHLTESGALRPGGAAVLVFEDILVDTVKVYVSKTLEEEAVQIGIADISVWAKVEDK